MQLTCKLTSPELQLRKSTVLAGLKAQILGKDETEDGFRLKFNGTDEMIGVLIEFIKTERQCCDFLSFHLSIGNDTSHLLLELSGPKGAKEFMITELGL